MPEEITPPVSAAWHSALLAPIVEINERMLERLHARAHRCASMDPAVTAGADAVRGMPPLIESLLSEWCALDAAALRRLAGCPYLLLDAGFAEPERWPTVGALAVHEAAHDASVRPQSTTASYLVDDEWRVLVRRTLLLGWHLARANPLPARVLLGMNASTAERIACTRLRDLDELAERSAGRVVPRWAHQPEIWRQLLRACRAPARELLWTQLRGLQLLAAAVAPPSWGRVGA